VQRVSKAVVVTPDGDLEAHVDCPSGTRVVSGGYAWPASTPTSNSQWGFVFQSYPSSATRWTFQLSNKYSNPQEVTLYALCAVAA
jgi:hypothetical protein